MLSQHTTDVHATENPPQGMFENLALMSGYSTQALFEVDERYTQFRLARPLRSAAIAHLRYGETPRMIGFRDCYNGLYKDKFTSHDLDSYLAHHNKNGVWGTEAQATALGDFFDFTVIVTEVADGEARPPYKLHETDPSRPTIHLYNSNNTHWYFYEGQGNKTIGDGNCLYNAFAQALRQLYFLEEANKKIKQPTSDRIAPDTETAVSDITTLSKEEQNAIDYQQKLLAEFSKVTFEDFDMTSSLRKTIPTEVLYYAVEAYQASETPNPPADEKERAFTTALAALQ